MRVKDSKKITQGFIYNNRTTGGLFTINPKF